MTLYEINAELAGLIDPETGELLDYERFEELNLERDTKLEQMALWIKDLQAESAAIRTEELALAERRKRSEKKAESLKNYLMRMLDGERFQTPRCSVSYRKSVAVEIPDEENFIAWAMQSGHDGFLNYGLPKVSKSEVKEFLARGNTLEGASLVEKTNLQIK